MTANNTSIQKDEVMKPSNPVSDTGDLSESEAAAILAKRYEDDKSPSNTNDEEETQQSEDETPSAEAEENGDDEDEQSEADHDEGEDNEEDEDSEEGDEEEAEQPTVAGDDAVVEVTVDGKTSRVSVKDLKRLAGQEASLTQKSQEVSVQLKKATETATRHEAALQALMKRASEKWEPYSKIDFLVASRTMSAEDFAALREDAQAAWNDVQFFQQELDASMKATAEKRQVEMQEAAKKGIVVLKEKIPDWSPETYQEILKYGVSQGIPADTMNTLVDPAAIILIDKARRFDAAKANTKMIKKKLVKPPKNAVKSNKATNNGADNKLSYKKALAKASSTGSAEDAVAALMAKHSD